MSDKFQKDLIKFYDLVEKNQRELGRLYGLVEDSEYENEKLQIYIDEFLDECDLKHSKENYLAALSRLVGLRDEQLVQVLNKQNIDKKEIEKRRSISYLWTKNFHQKRHEKFIDDIEKENLLNPFYRELLRGVHEIGLVMSEWQFEWNEYIINNINQELKDRYGENVIEFLKTNNLFDKDENGDIADRSYSVLQNDNGKYKILTYAEFFGIYVEKIVNLLDELVKKLSALDENNTNQKDCYIRYFNSLSIAFAEKEKTMLLKRWREVDRAWMDVVSPIQVGHPLEYYEDHYRKAVALEWDIRVTNPRKLNANRTYKAICNMYEKLFEKFGDTYGGVKSRTIENLNRIQLYIGRPALFYASEFNGLFSAQVVPNDEQVSKERGKKVFAFADNILDTQKSKPFLKIDRVVFGDDFVSKEREFVFKKEKIWHKVYEVSTIGHEFGHILWLDSDSEIIMNKSGVFKNIEEFKATTGGLVAFFMDEDEKIKEYVFLELIKRAVKLITWRKVNEVEPYYCEGLIHLNALFDSGVLEFDDTLSIRMDDLSYEKLKNWYIRAYSELAEHYLLKKDAKVFLDRYLCKEGEDYMPKNKKIGLFVDYFWDLHKNIGREIDTSVDKKDWV